MTFMSRKISNDLENMGATAGYIGDKAKCEFFFPFVSEARAIQDTRLKKSQSISKQCRNFMLMVFTFSAGKPPRHP